MNKLLPHLPLLTLVLGLLSVQVIQHGNTGALLSSAISDDQTAKTVEVCTKPAFFSSSEESAWCNIGLVSGIEERHHSWKWSCMVGEKNYTCHFTENVSYPTRGANLFIK